MNLLSFHFFLQTDVCILIRLIIVELSSVSLIFIKNLSYFKAMTRCVLFPKAHGKLAVILSGAVLEYLTCDLEARCSSHTRCHNMLAFHLIHTVPSTLSHPE